MVVLPRVGMLLWLVAFALSTLASHVVLYCHRSAELPAACTDESSASISSSENCDQRRIVSTKVRSSVTLLVLGATVCSITAALVPFYDFQWAGILWEAMQLLHIPNSAPATLLEVATNFSTWVAAVDGTQTADRIYVAFCLALVVFLPVIQGATLLALTWSSTGSRRLQMRLVVLCESIGAWCAVDVCVVAFAHGLVCLRNEVRLETSFWSSLGWTTTGVSGVQVSQPLKPCILCLHRLPLPPNFGYGSHWSTAHSGRSWKMNTDISSL